MSIRLDIISSNYLDYCFEVHCEYTIPEKSLETSNESTTSKSFKVPFFEHHSLVVGVIQRQNTIAAFLSNLQLVSTHTSYSAFVVKCDGEKINIVNSVHAISNKGLEEYLHDGNKLHLRFKIYFHDYEVSEIHKGLLKLYKSIDNDPSDFSIKTWCGSLRVTKNILMIKWKYFRILIDIKRNGICNNDCCTDVWVVDNISFGLLKDIVGYVYCDAITFKGQDHVVKLLKAGHRFRLNNLVRACSKYLIAVLSSKNVLSMLVLSDTYGLTKLKDSSSKLVSEVLEYQKMATLEGYEEYIKYSNHQELTESCLEDAVRKIIVLRKKRTL
ncbi:hypothetical protein HDE_08813 [Halotydeus destructor]|nr:hypothetical protein HDE_08813 [Halotydeus destructor]